MLFFGYLHNARISGWTFCYLMRSSILLQRYSILPIWNKKLSIFVEKSSKLSNQKRPKNF